MLPSDLRKKFDHSRAAIKYVELKVMGEVLGGLLNKLRSDMFSDMIKHSPTCKIIDQSKKKTVMFSTYVDVVDNAAKYVKDKCSKNPIVVYGATSGNIKNLLMSFKHNPDANPLIATIQTLSTGVTLVEANTVIFLNKPWRHTDIIQATDRLHRIGQDTDVFIYTYVLDSGGKPNLSTRMEDIISWSKEMFEGIVGSENITESVIFNDINFGGFI